MCNQLANENWLKKRYYQTIAGIRINRAGGREVPRSEDGVKSYICIYIYNINLSKLLTKRSDSQCNKNELSDKTRNSCARSQKYTTKLCKMSYTLVSY